MLGIRHAHELGVFVSVHDVLTLAHGGSRTDVFDEVHQVFARDEVSVFVLVEDGSRRIIWSGGFCFSWLVVLLNQLSHNVVFVCRVVFVVFLSL